MKTFAFGVREAGTVPAPASSKSNMISKDRYGNNLVLGGGQNWDRFKLAQIPYWNLSPDPLPWALGFLVSKERDGSLPTWHSSLQSLPFLDIALALLGRQSRAYGSAGRVPVPQQEP